MNLRLLLAWFFSYLHLGVVAGGGGGAANEDDGEPDDLDEEADDVDDTPTDGDADEEGDGDDKGDEGEGDDADAEVTIGFGEEPTPPEEDESRAPGWVRELRERARKDKRLLQERDAEIARLKGAQAPVKVEVGPKPLAKDYELYEPEQAAKYEADLVAWSERNAAAQVEAKQQQQAEDAAQREWTGRLKAVDDAGAALKVPDNAEAVEALADTFSVPQMGMLIDAATDAKSAAKLRYALGKNPAKAKELAAIKHPVKFIAAIARLEGQLKETPRKAAPPPESKVSSAGAGKASAVDNQLERAREEARKTGNYTKVAELNRQQAARARKRAA